MNIKKLIEQATTIEEHGWGASYEHFDKEKFAELVAAHERERLLAGVEMPEPFYEGAHIFTKGKAFTTDQLRETVAAAVAREREECAKMVDHILKEGGGTYGDAIRARSKA